MRLDEPYIPAQRIAEIRTADCSRVIPRFYTPGGVDRAPRIIKRVMTIPEEEVSSVLDDVMEEFAYRHQRLENVLLKHYEDVKQWLPAGAEPTEKRKMLIGAYFTAEYSVQAVGVANPSMVLHPDQGNLRQGEVRYLVSFRSIGEGHISSMEFRSWVIDSELKVKTRPICDFLAQPERLPMETFRRDIFQAQLKRRSVYSKSLAGIIDRLPPEFAYSELEKELVETEARRLLPKRLQNEIKIALRWMRETTYVAKFGRETRFSNRVLMPQVDNENHGIEDVRWVRFVDDDGESTYYGTYTGYNGCCGESKVLETKDFRIFKSWTMIGRAVQNKGVALFPRRINGRYAMLSRIDNESNYVAFSDSPFCWGEAQFVRGPESPWEFIQIGNCGAPIETDFGWLVITHGVGPMRKYCLGIDILDLENPEKLIGRVPRPILTPNEYEREGYVPNVVYSCGGVLQGRHLILPYAMSDWASGVVTMNIDDVKTCLF